MHQVAETRRRGYACAIETWAAGMSSCAVAVAAPGSERVGGVVSVAGPSVRLTEAAIEALIPELRQAAEELSAFAPLADYLESINPAPPRPASMR